MVLYATGVCFERVSSVPVRAQFWSEIAGLAASHPLTWDPLRRLAELVQLLRRQGLVALRTRWPCATAQKMMIDARLLVSVKRDRPCASQDCDLGRCRLGEVRALKRLEEWVVSPMLAKNVGPIPDAVGVLLVSLRLENVLRRSEERYLL